MGSAAVPGIDWGARALLLARVTIGWNVLEGLVAIGFGWAEESVALLGFGLDSWVEVGSAAIVHWKLTRAAGCATTAREQERRATRWISALFLALAVGTAAGAALQLLGHRQPESTLAALLVSATSLSFMFALWRAKLAAARALDSRTLAMDAACSRACIELSAVLLAGSLLGAVAPALWWADAGAALGLAVLIGREGVEGWRAANAKDFSGGCGCSGGG